MAFGSLALGGCTMFDGKQGAGELAGRTAPGSIPANISSDTLIKIAESTRASGDFGSAISFYRRAVAINPSDFAALIGLGDTLNMAGVPNEAVTAYREALALKPSDPEALRGMGAALLALNQPASAIELFDKANAAKPDARSLAGLGVAQDLLGNYQAAEAAYKRGLALAPKDLGLRNNLGLSEALAGEYDRAIATLRQVATDPAAGPRHRLNLALALGLAGRMEEAAQVARIDLDERAVQSNLAYYAELRALPPTQRAQAILRPGVKGAVPPQAPAATCDAPPCSPAASVKHDPAASKAGTGKGQADTHAAAAAPVAPVVTQRMPAAKPTSHLEPQSHGRQAIARPDGFGVAHAKRVAAHLAPRPLPAPRALAIDRHDETASAAVAAPSGKLTADRPDDPSTPGAAAAVEGGPPPVDSAGSIKDLLNPTSAPAFDPDAATTFALIPAVAPPLAAKHAQTAAHVALRSEAGRWVQLGALRDSEAAEDAWKRLVDRNPDLLETIDHAVRRTDLGPSRGIYYRLRAGPFASLDEARSLCSQLRSRDVACVAVAIE